MADPLAPKRPSPSTPDSSNPSWSGAGGLSFEDAERLSSGFQAAWEEPTAFPAQATADSTGKQTPISKQELPLKKTLQGVGTVPTGQGLGDSSENQNSSAIPRPKAPPKPGKAEASAAPPGPIQPSPEKSQPAKPRPPLKQQTLLGVAPPKNAPPESEVAAEIRAEKSEAAAEPGGSGDTLPEAPKAIEHAKRSKSNPQLDEELAAENKAAQGASREESSAAKGEASKGASEESSTGALRKTHEEQLSAKSSVKKAEGEAPRPPLKSDAEKSTKKPPEKRDVAAAKPATTTPLPKPARAAVVDIPERFTPPPPASKEHYKYIAITAVALFGIVWLLTSRGGDDASKPQAQQTQEIRKESKPTNDTSRAPEKLAEPERVAEPEQPAEQPRFAEPEPPKAEPAAQNNNLAEPTPAPRAPVIAQNQPSTPPPAVQPKPAAPAKAATAQFPAAQPKAPPAAAKAPAPTKTQTAPQTKAPSSSGHIVRETPF